MVSSGLRKDIWAKRGFLEQFQYSEDDEYTRWCRAQGYRVVYCPDSVVMHSHNYTAQQAYRRSFGEAKAYAGVHSGRAGDLNWPRLSPWRELVSQLFDAPSMTPLLRQIRRVRIERAAPDEGRGRQAGALATVRGA